MAEFIAFILIVTALVAAIALLVGFMSDSGRALQVGIGAAAMAIVSALVLAGAGEYIAGQGGAPQAAEAWVKKHRPAWKVGECQPRDTDGNKYITCTIDGPDGEVEPIECGVGRWYHGYGVTGCKPVFYQSTGRR